VLWYKPTESTLPYFPDFIKAYGSVSDGSEDPATQSVFTTAHRSLRCAHASLLTSASDDGVEAPAATNQTTARAQRRTSHAPVAYDETGCSTGPALRITGRTHSLRPRDPVPHARENGNNDHDKVRGHERRRLFRYSEDAELYEDAASYNVLNDCLFHGSLLCGT
jgi:hypothetical protein